MKAFVYLLLLLLSVSSLKADEVIPVDSLLTLLVGNWEYRQSNDACGMDVTGLYYDEVQITFYQEAIDQGTDRVSAGFEYKTDSGWVSETLKFTLLFNETYGYWQMNSLDSSAIYPNQPLNLNVITTDSMSLSWLLPCLACHCGQVDFFKRAGNSTALEDPIRAYEWRVYPNPLSISGGLFFLDIGRPQEEALQVLVLNEMGQRVYERRVRGGKTVLPAGGFLPGYYTICLQKGEASSCRKLLLLP